MPPVAPELTNHQSQGNLGEMTSTRIRIRTPEGGQNMNPQYGQLQPNTLVGNAQQNNLRGSAELDRQNGRSLTQIELKRLAQRDVVLIIDQSSSMMMHDCPGAGSSGGAGIASAALGGLFGLPIGGAVSRWQWCTEQTSELSRQTAEIFDRGITVVLFSSAYEVFQQVRMRQVASIFAQNHPMGGTNLAPALASQIGAYFKRRAETRGNVKPVVIGIVTDGCPNNRQAVKQAIIEATQMMRTPQEICIVFFLIGGMDPQGERFVANLESNLVSSGAAYPIVKGISFDQLKQVGLAKALALSLQ